MCDSPCVRRALTFHTRGCRSRSTTSASCEVGCRVPDLHAVLVAVVHYPDCGKVGIWTEDNGYESMLRTEPELDYWEGEA